MRHLVLVGALGLLGLNACAVGVASPDGQAWGVALGQAEIRSCRADVAPPTEASCSYVRGGAVSEEGGKALGLVSRLLGFVSGGLL